RRVAPYRGFEPSGGFRGLGGRWGQGWGGPWAGDGLPVLGEGKCSGIGPPMVRHAHRLGGGNSFTRLQPQTGSQVGKWHTPGPVPSRTGRQQGQALEGDCCRGHGSSREGQRRTAALVDRASPLPRSSVRISGRFALRLTNPPAHHPTKLTRPSRSTRVWVTE